MAIEVLALNIINNKSINGIKVTDVEIKICQYADDMTFFLSNTNSVREVLSLCNLFSLFSGLKLNMNKTLAMRIGITKNNSGNNLGVKWSEKIDILGIIYLYNMQYVNESFQKLVDKANAIIKPWFLRELTLYGRILLVKSLIYSLFQYISQVYVIPDRYVKIINNIVWKFINKGKKKFAIKRQVLYKEYEKGGLKMLNFECLQKRQRIMWIKRFVNDPNSS